MSVPKQPRACLDVTQSVFNTVLYFTDGSVSENLRTRTAPVPHHLSLPICSWFVCTGHTVALGYHQWAVSVSRFQGLAVVGSQGGVHC